MPQGPQPRCISESHSIRQHLSAWFPSVPEKNDNLHKGRYPIACFIILLFPGLLQFRNTVMLTGSMARILTALCRKRNFYDV
ncbi:MAG: hypothetical protein J1E16_05745 [Muribaculaceae bacterium]|nr:hypothetical protein [Muribaculaceae bacterium]